MSEPLSSPVTNSQREEWAKEGLIGNEYLAELSYRFDSANDELLRLRSALEDIARQWIGDEIDEDTRKYADYKAGYETCIKKARAALATTAEGTTREGERSFPAELRQKRGRPNSCLIEAILHPDGYLELKNKSAGWSLFFRKSYLDEALRIEGQGRGART